MYILLALGLWLGGFLLSAFNYANRILASIEPAAARKHWQPSSITPMFGLCRIACLLLMVAGISILDLSDSVDVYWVYFLLCAFFVIIFSLFFSSVLAWRYVRGKFPQQVEAFRLNRERSLSGRR
ncbi:hypothetical protein LJC48_05560 [Desulfovibrio sp. OttesenSCG-928-C06]|nr:hypothetical protein [Desulfovibrio sp. OttesenSCG-928-C06]